MVENEWRRTYFFIIDGEAQRHVRLTPAPVPLAPAQFFERSPVDKRNKLYVNFTRCSSVLDESRLRGLYGRCIGSAKNPAMKSRDLRKNPTARECLLPNAPLISPVGFLYRGRDWAPMQADPCSSLAEPNVIHAAVSMPGAQGFGDKQNTRQSIKPKYCPWR
jgi:hypothetical protein